LQNETSYQQTESCNTTKQSLNTQSLSTPIDYVTKEIPNTYDPIGDDIENGG
jgi:hypothetical protein